MLYVNVSHLLSLCSMFEEHHVAVFNIVWEMVVISDANLKTNAAALLKALVSVSLIHYKNALVVS
jgi:hypothetical protein